MRVLQVTTSSIWMLASGSPSTSQLAVTVTLGIEDSAISTSSTCQGALLSHMKLSVVQFIHHTRSAASDCWGSLMLRPSRHHSQQPGKSVPNDNHGERIYIKERWTCTT